MKYLLMQKNYPVMDLTLSKDGTQITDVGIIYDEKRIPLGLQAPFQQSLNHWWHHRAIPASRSGLTKALETLGMRTPEELLSQCLGLSLSDQYWIKPKSMVVSWEQVNFFDNPFSEDVGNILLGEKLSGEFMSLCSPDGSVNGWLKKKWKIINGKRYLLKGCSNFWSEPFNEVIASMIADRLNFSHVEYEICYEGKHHTPMSICENFITPNTEFIEASQIGRILTKLPDETKYQHFCRCCDALHIPDYEKSLDEMLVLDYLIANQDRHKGNFGAIRNVETMDFVGFAPIFDCGTSLRYDTPDIYIDPDLNVESQPFCSFHDEQIQLVQHPEHFDFNVLQGLSEEICVLFEDERAKAYISTDRAEKIIAVVTARIEMLKHFFGNIE